MRCPTRSEWSVFAKTERKKFREVLHEKSLNHNKYGDKPLKLLPYQRDSLHIMFCVRKVECDKIWQKRERTVKDALTFMCLRDLTFKSDSLSLSCDSKTRSFELSSPAQNSTAKPAVTGCDNKKTNWGSDRSLVSL